jgi:hypothetical protein
MIEMKGRDVETEGTIVDGFLGPVLFKSSDEDFDTIQPGGDSG